MSKKHQPVVIAREHSPHRVKHKFWRGVGDIATFGGVSAWQVTSHRAQNAIYNANTRRMARNAEKDEEKEAGR